MTVNISKNTSTGTIKILEIVSIDKIHRFPITNYLITILMIHYQLLFCQSFRSNLSVDFSFG